MNVPSSTKRRRAPWLVAAVVIVPLAAIAAIYLLFFTKDSPVELKLSDPPSTEAGASATTVAGSASGSTVAGTWTVGSGSVAGYRVREKLASLPAQSDAVGRTESVTGTVTLRTDGSRLVADAVDIEVDVSTLKSDENRRDNRIKTSGLETDRFPKATFTSTAPTALPDNLAAGEAVHVEITGDLTIHGATKRVTIPVDVRVTGSQGEVDGSLKFSMSDFEMTPPSVGGFVTVEPDATLEFNLRLAHA